MTEVGKKAPGQLAWFIRRIKDQLVRDVPDEVAVCEFDCKKNQCLDGEWISCERRAAGELKPDSPIKPRKLKP